MALNRISALSLNLPIVDTRGIPTPEFQRLWQGVIIQAGEGATVATDFGPAIAQKVSKGVSTGWAAPTGTASKATFASYTAPVASLIYDAAELQAVMDHVQILSQRLNAVITALKANETFGP